MTTRTHIEITYNPHLDCAWLPDLDARSQGSPLHSLLQQHYCVLYQELSSSGRSVCMFTADIHQRCTATLGIHFKGVNLIGDILHTDLTPLDMQCCAPCRHSLPRNICRSQRLPLTARSSVRPAARETLLPTSAATINHALFVSPHT